MASGGSGVKTDALANSGAATANANAQYNLLAPTYAQMATGNDGLTQQQKSDLLTSSGQAIGGSAAAITGQGALQEARTGSSGTYSAIADAALRSAGAQQSDNALGVQNQSDAIARQNQQIGLQGEQSLYNTNSSQALNYLSLANNAKTPFLETYLLNGQQALARSAAAGAGG